MKVKQVHLGFEVGTGRSIEVPLKHMAITGMTQESGKTTCLEALISRSGFRAISFITKRGEGSFRHGRPVSPFFREKADWLFVSSLIDATLGAKNRMLHAWLMKVCRNTKTLAEVQENVRREKATARGFPESMFTQIEGYLELVVPQLAELPPVRSVTIGDGLNVMDLSPYSSELQSLVIRSVLEHVYENEKDVLTIIPEAWEFIPEGRGSPVKQDAETLMRKGAALHNYMWVDSQDLAGVWKLVIRGCPVVLIGVQREANEIKRTLENIPAGVPKLTKKDIAELELGQFYACWGRNAIKTYVQPAWMDAEEAKAIAMGTKSIAAVSAPTAPTLKKEESVASEVLSAIASLSVDVGRLSKRFDDLHQRLQAVEDRPQPDPFVGLGPAPTPALENLRHSRVKIHPPDERVGVAVRIPTTERNNGDREDYDMASYEEFREKMMNDRVFMDHVASSVLAHLPSNGTVKVEPREVVLKAFHNQEVDRLVSTIENRSIWQKQVLRYLEARNVALQKAAIVTAVLGRQTSHMARDFKKEYEEIDELVNLGFVTKYANGSFRSNLGEVVKNKLAQYEASEQEVADAIGQMLLRLK